MTDVVDEQTATYECMLLDALSVSGGRLTHVSGDGLTALVAFIERGWVSVTLTDAGREAAERYRNEVDA
jgi:hypothetical protein